MTQLFRSMGSDWRPVSEIQAIGPLVQTVGQMKFAIVTMKNGEDIRVADYEFEDLLHRPIQIMPVDRGTKLIHYLLDAAPEHWTIPLSGWALCVDGITRPMTLAVSYAIAANMLMAICANGRRQRYAGRTECR